MLPILLILFLGYVGFSISLPLFPPLMLEESHGFLTGSYSGFTRNVLLGLLLAMYPLGQFFGCPLIGRFSDRFGRKKVLLFSLGATIPTFIISAFAIHYSQVMLLFIARFFCGLFEGNVVIAQAAMADISETPKEKSRYFSWGVTASSLAFVIGPLLGGKLSDPTLVSFFSFSTPFTLSAIVVILTFIYMAFQFKETRNPSAETNIHPLLIFRSIYNGTKSEKIRPIYRNNFLIFIAIFFFFNFLPVFLVKKFDMNPSSLSEVEAYLSVPIAIAPFFEGKLSNKLSPITATISSALVLGLGTLILIPFSSKYALLATLIPPGFALAFALTYTTVLVSMRTEKESQGEALGINQSLQVFAEAFTAILGGFLAAKLASLPLIVSALFAFIGAGCYFIHRKKAPL